MAATVQINEINGSSPGTQTENITNSNYGTTDAVNLDPTAFPIVPGDNSYQKWQRWDVTAMGGSASVRKLRFFADAAPSPNTAHMFNGHTTQLTYENSDKLTYETPDRLDDDCPNAVPTSAPGSANIGIGGALAGEITTDDNQSDFIVHMITTEATALAGSLLQLSYMYDEIAVLPLFLTICGSLGMASILLG